MSLQFLIFNSRPGGPGGPENVGLGLIIFFLKANMSEILTNDSKMMLINYQVGLPQKLVHHIFPSILSVLPNLVCLNKTNDQITVLIQ